MACLCSCEVLDACAQVEDPSGSADRQDSSGTLQWEAHIKVLSTAAAPPQHAAAAIPVQRHRREDAEREKALPGSTDKAAQQGHIAPSAQQSSQNDHAAAGQAHRAIAGTGAASSLQEAEGQSQSAAAQEQPQVAPWTDADGALNKPYWRSLTQRAMSAVLRSPGMPLLHRYFFMSQLLREEAGSSTHCHSCATDLSKRHIVNEEC